MNEIDNTPLSTFQIVSNVFVKMYNFTEPGQKIQGHSHKFDHITLLATGSVLMRSNEEVTIHKAPVLIVTPKGITHEFQSLSNKVVLCCVHAIRDSDDLDGIADPNVSQEQAMDLLINNPLILKQ